MIQDFAILLSTLNCDGSIDEFGEEKHIILSIINLLIILFAIITNR